LDFRIPSQIFKAGSTVPVKFQLKKADGTPIRANSDPKWITPLKGSPTTEAIDEITYTGSATDGGTFRWDATSQQYIYNWNTKSLTTPAGFYYRIGVTLDDGSTHHVNVGLR
jgi:hypothetical protein